ncbi:unnamed protein product, partial [Allacma fusca]
MPEEITEKELCEVGATVQQENVITVFFPTTSESAGNSNTEVASATVTNKRVRKRKLFFDEEDKLLNVRAILIQNDKDLHVTFGSEIINVAESLKPIPPKLRRFLVKTMCQNLVKQCHSAMPSTDQRNQLAECIVSQLYPTFTGKEWKELKDSYFSPSTTVYDPKRGTKRSLSPTGHIQYHFKNFWSSLRQGNGSFKLKSLKDPIAEEDFENNEPDTDSISMKNWLVNHAAPPQKVFEYMVKTFKYRRMELLKCKHDSDY